MTHIKKINEMANIKPFTKTVYALVRCEFNVAEDNHERGEINESGFRPLDYRKGMEADTLEGLMKKFNDEECYGHEFNIEDWVYDSTRPNCLQLCATGTLVDDYASFYEPSKKDWEDFEKGLTNLSVFTYELYIEKREVTTELVSDFEELGVSEM